MQRPFVTGIESEGCMLSGLSETPGDEELKQMENNS